VLEFPFTVPTEHLNLEVRDGSVPGQRVLALTGVLTLSTLFSFQDFAHADKSETLIADMSGVPYIDSAGLGSLIGAYVSREREARKLVLAGVNDRVKMVMTVTGVEQLFQIYATVPEAEKTLAAAASSAS
jgi:anti-sigma B factor antagonist